MSVKISMKCDKGYSCYQEEVTPNTSEQAGWFEISGVPIGLNNVSDLRVRMLGIDDKVDMNALHACPGHGLDVATQALSKLSVFAPETEVKSEEDIPY